MLFLFFAFFSKAYALTSDYSYLNEEIHIPSVQAQNILFYNLDENKVIYEKNSSEKIAIASLTKIMTSIVAIEKIENLNEVVQVPAGAFSNLDGYTTAGFKINDSVTYNDLLYATLLPSGADAAQALALLTYQDMDTFVAKMNEYAQKLGMNNTHYSNPVGRDSEENYSTVEDLLKLLLYALKNEDFYQAYTTRNYITLNQLELESTLVLPSEKYHFDIHMIKGSKSGFTSKAGLCLSSIAENEGKQYLLITTGSSHQNNYPNHIADSLAIYNYFFEHFGYVNLLEENQILKTIPVLDATIKEYEIKSKMDVPFYLEKGMKEELVYEYQGIEKLTSKIKPNTKLGIVKVKYKDKELYQQEVYLQEKIKYNYTIEIFIVSMSILLVFVFMIIIRVKKENKNNLGG